jgi:uncharacterized protein (TIGR02271 family)
MKTQTATSTATVGVFHNRADAQACVNDLKGAGFRDDEIGMVTRHEGDADVTDGDGNKAGEGAAIGVATGAGVGALWALGIAAGLLPAIGPVIAGGMFASILASAAGGAAVGGLVGALVGLGVPEEEAEYYESEVKAGRTIVTVKAGRRAGLVREIIQRHHGYDRSSASVSSASVSSTPVTSTIASGDRATGLTGQKTSRVDKSFADTDACDLPANRRPTAGHTDEKSMKLSQEELHARKDLETTGEVRVRKDVVTEHKTMDVPVMREEVVIERRPAGDKRATSSDLRPGEEIRIPVKEEHVHLDKSAHVVEEVNVGKRKVQGKEHVAGDVRKEVLRVDKEGQPRVQGTDRP